MELTKALKGKIKSSCAHASLIVACTRTGGVDGAFVKLRIS